LEVENDDNMLEARTIDGVFWRYKNIFFRSWNRWEHVEIKDDVWCILTLFETILLKLELLRIF